jgi:hypothetical protein
MTPIRPDRRFSDLVHGGLYFFGSSNIANRTRTIVDPLLEIVHGGVGGAVMAAALRRVPVANVSPA